MFTVTLTREEAHALLALIDAGVKALGRPAAKACALLDDKVQAALMRDRARSPTSGEAAPNGAEPCAGEPAA